MDWKFIIKGDKPKTSGTYLVTGVIKTNNPKDDQEYYTHIGLMCFNLDKKRWHDKYNESGRSITVYAWCEVEPYTARFSEFVGRGVVRMNKDDWYKLISS